MNLTKKEWLLLVLFLVLVTFPLQYIFRALDLSTLTSWRWVFSGVGPARMFIVLALAVLLVMPLSFFGLPQKHPKLFLYASAILSSLSFLSIPEVLLDSSRYFLQAKYLAQNGIAEFFRAWGTEITPWTDLPLVPVFYGVLYKLFGEERLVIAIFNSLLFSGIPILIFLIGRLLWDHSTGFIAGMLSLASPYLFIQVPLMLVDIHTMFFLLLAVCIFLYTLKQGGALWSIVSAIAICLALFTKYSTWPMLGALGIIVLTKLDSEPKTVLMRTLTVASLTALLLGLIYLWKGEIIMQQIHFLRTYQMAGLQRWQEGYQSAFFFQTHPFVFLAALFGICRAFLRRDKNILILLWFAALVLILGLKRVRYLLPLLPFLALAGAYGLQIFKHDLVRRYIAYCCLASSLAVALFAYKPFLAGTSMANLKDAGEFLDALPYEAVEVYCLPQVNSLGNTAVAVPILDLYTDKIIYQQQPWNSAEGQQRAQNVSLRFTWELKQPNSYRLSKYSGQQLPLIIIASKPVSIMPPALKKRFPDAKLLQQFTKSSGVFRYQTFVSVFAPQ